MFQIGKTLVSDHLLSEEFVCNLSKCKGECCVDGDAGAPLDNNELAVLDDIYEDIKPFLRQEGINTINAIGKYEMDTDGEWTTPLVDSRECAYLTFDSDKIAKCGIEKAYEAGVINFQKPVSCHLYPVRLRKYSEFTAVNYEVWDICSDACILGKELKVNVATFLKVPLTRKFGQEWYDELMLIQQELLDKDKR